ncbi:MAG: DUF4013 domain-containing protein [Anaerolineae bacterium]|nr:DUF4013 domain-containing protein [Anaerolineae bacterium]
MSISDALNYPFNNGNLLKILPIAIVYGIIAVLANYATINGMTFLICGAVVALLIFTFVLGGYYISIIEAVQYGEARMPDVQISRDLSRGVAAWLAGILYGLPLVLIFCAASVFPAMLSSADRGGMGSALVFAVAAVFIITLMFFLGLALLVGYNRYAAEGTTQGLFALTENFGIAWNHAGLGLGLVLRSIVVGFVNLVVVFTLQFMVNLFFPQQLGLNAQPSTFYWIIFALIQVLSYTISLFFIASQYHLIAWYGLSLGILGEGDASQVDGVINPWLIVALVIGLLLVLGVVVIIILTTLGPSIGSIFEEINQQLMMTAQPR